MYVDHHTADDYCANQRIATSNRMDALPALTMVGADIILKSSVCARRLAPSQMTKQVFFDPQRKRWKRLRLMQNVLVLLGLLLGTIFIVGLMRMKPLPELPFDTQKRNYRALSNPALLKAGQKLRRSAHRKTDLKPSDVRLNSGEGLRAAYYVEWDAASYSSLKQHIKQIDLLFPEWLHVLTPNGSLTSYTIDNRSYPVVDSSGTHSVDIENKVARTIALNQSNTEVFPLVNNFDPVKNVWMPSVGDFLSSETARASFLKQIDTFLAANPNYRGISLDFESIPAEAQPGYKALIAALYDDFHARNLRLYVNTPVADDDFDLKYIADHSDGLLLMNYDEHQSDSGPGPIASQDWFIDNLKNVLKTVPKEKIICSIGSYGYDWTLAIPPPVKKGHKPPPEKVIMTQDVSAQEAWQAAYDSDSKVDLDDDSLNAHFAYDDEDAHVRHQIWFLDAVTVLNQMRAARALGIQTYALWRLGSEDNSLWNIWDSPLHSDPVKALATVEPGYDVDTEGEGDILRITRKPQPGQRTVTMDDDGASPPEYRTITEEWMDSYPLSYTVTQYGYHPKQVALSFDDGPDPDWTPRILDILKKYNVKGTFFMIGEEAEKYVGVMQRVYREGHEIGNHTFTHPDISEVSNTQVDLQLNLTERLFASKLGVQPLYFRPPYSIDQEPDTNDQAAPVDRIQGLGYITIGNKIDTNDWDENPRKSPKEITDSVFAQIADMDKRPWTRGSIILLHDGGGDRSATIAALPVLIKALRAHGYEIVPVSQLMGKTRAEVMPPLTPQQRWQARADSVAFFLFGFFNNFVVGVFFVGDILMSARLIIIGVCAIIDRVRKRKNYATRRVRPQGCRPDPGLQRRKGHRPNHPVRDDVHLQEHPHHRHRRRLQRQHLRSRPRRLPSGYRLWPPDRADQAERRQSRGAELRTRALRRRDLRRHRCRHRHRPRCHRAPCAPLRQPEDRRSRRQCQSRQPRQSLDTLASARIHHEPELRTPRPRPLRCRHRGTRRNRRMAHISC